MGYSNTELANQALSHIGRDDISSLAEDSASARKVNAVFERSIYSALSRSRWSFHRKLQVLASVTNDWEERWAYKYDIPSDCATFVRIVPASDVKGATPPAHQLLGSAIYTNEPTAKGEYVHKTTSTVTMGEPFLDAVSFLIARNVSMPLTRKRSFWNDMNQSYEYHLALAIQHDAGQEAHTWTGDDGGYIDARGGGASYTGGAAPDGSIYWE